MPPPAIVAFGSVRSIPFPQALAIVHPLIFTELPPVFLSSIYWCIFDPVFDHITSLIITELLTVTRLLTHSAGDGLVSKSDTAPVIIEILELPGDSAVASAPRVMVAVFPLV